MSRKVAPYQDLVRIAREAATRGAERIRQMTRPRDPRSWGQKEAFSDFVTEVDRAAEECIAESLLAHTPEAAVLGEELSPDGPDAPLLWIVDPLDGTANFLHGHPFYCASVAVAVDGRPVAGAVVSGASGERWWASRGDGAFKGGRQIRVSQVARLIDALVGTGFPFKRLDLLPRYLGQFERVLREASGVRRAGAAALDLCFLAQGSLDAFWEEILMPWDFAAGLLIVQEAGGVMAGPDGEELSLEPGAVRGANGSALLLELQEVLREL